MFLSRFEVRFFTAKTISGSFIKTVNHNGLFYQLAAADVDAFETAIYSRNDIKEIHLTFEDSGLLFHEMVLTNIYTENHPSYLTAAPKFIATSVYADYKTLQTFTVKTEQLAKDYDFVVKNLQQVSSAPLNISSPLVKC